jgi:hypothetical protein
MDHGSVSRSKVPFHGASNISQVLPGRLLWIETRSHFQTERRIGLHHISHYHAAVLGKTTNQLPCVAAMALLFVTCQSAFSRPEAATGQRMVKNPPPSSTNSIPRACWHTITIPPAPSTPLIHFYDKLNPVWWLENADDPVPPKWYLPGDPHRGLKWRFRNPLHNFDHYVIGVADKQFSRSGRYPERNSDPHGGWDFEIAHRKLAVLPFISYERYQITFYFGWREHGAFGIELKHHKTLN